MAVTKTLIETFVGDTIQRTVPVTLTVDGVAVTDMSGWTIRATVDTPTPTTATPDNADAATASFGFVITDEQTASWPPGTYNLYAKLEAPTLEEFTIIHGCVVVAAQGVA